MPKEKKAQPRPFDRKTLGLNSAQLKELDECEAELVKIGRRTTKETFDLGERLAVAQELVPDGMFSTWLKTVSDYSRQHVHTVVTIATVLAKYKARLIDVRMAPTTMGKLANAPEHVDHVLGEFEAGRRLTGAQVGVLVKGVQQKPAVDLPNAGGIHGLRALAQAKAKLGISEFAQNISMIAEHVDEAIAPALDGKRVLKGRLADQIERPARLARFQLENIATFVELNPRNSAASQVMHCPEGTGWREVWELLWLLGGRDSWPREGLDDWLCDKVGPILEWCLTGDVSSPVGWQPPIGSESVK